MRCLSMQGMGRRFLLGAVLAGLMLPARADAPDAQRIALAKSYLEVTKQTITAEQLADVVVQAAVQKNPALKDPLAEIVPPLVPQFKPYISTMMDEIARLYASKFTADELTAIIAFYKTPAGAKLAEQNSALEAEVGQISRRWGARFGDDLREAMRKELDARGIKP